jgi:CheY-like chemotaxis protein
VVDDNAANRALLVQLFAPLGFAVREAVNGEEAIAIWQAWAPHLIWMDMRMPMMDGYEATRRIKATVQGQATVIVALTASALEEDRRLILSEGCDDYVRKPFREEALFEALQRHLGVAFVYEDEAGATAVLPPNSPQPSR